MATCLKKKKSFFWKKGIILSPYLFAKLLKILQQRKAAMVFSGIHIQSCAELILTRWAFTILSCNVGNTLWLAHSWAIIPFHTLFILTLTKGFLSFSRVYTGNIGQKRVKATSLNEFHTRTRLVGRNHRQLYEIESMWCI